MSTAQPTLDDVWRLFQEHRISVCWVAIRRDLMAGL